MSIDIITNHGQQALKRLLEQYKNQPNIKSVIDIYTNQVQDLEQNIHDMFLNRALPNASGQQLDQLGAIVGEPRNGNNDERYRVLIAVRIGKNISQGEIDRITSVFQLLTESDYAHLIVLNNANIQLQSTIFYADQDEVNFIFNSMQEVVAGGVRIAYIICADTSEAFAYAGVNTGAPALGYDDGSNTSGGKYGTPYEFRLPFAYAGSDPDAEGYGAGSLDPLAGGVYL